MWWWRVEVLTSETSQNKDKITRFEYFSSFFLVRFTVRDFVVAFRRKQTGHWSNKTHLIIVFWIKIQVITWFMMKLFLPPLLAHDGRVGSSVHTTMSWARRLLGYTSDGVWDSHPSSSQEIMFASLGVSFGVHPLLLLPFRSPVLRPPSLTSRMHRGIDGGSLMATGAGRWLFVILTTHLDYIAVKFPWMSEDVGNTSRLVRGNVVTMWRSWQNIGRIQVLSPVHPFFLFLHFSTPTLAPIKFELLSSVHRHFFFLWAHLGVATVVTSEESTHSSSTSV